MRALAVLRNTRPAAAPFRRLLSTSTPLRGAVSSTEPLQPQETITADQASALGLNDDRLIGDYPHVQREYYQHRDPKIKYDDQQQKRNFGEPLYEFYDTVDVWSPDRFDMVSDSTAVRNVTITAGLFAAFATLVYLFADHESPAVRRQYPHDGLYKALGATEEDKEVFQARKDPEY